ncbi:MAG: hypothetical protein MR707_02975 [Galactobacillus timonensis]|uniref:hypothetical protein n=1 Tax=Galactobacillus timonensis TaxID=2041840 RepID=UPI0023F12E55|nr:hypothetical protein [Galactobacillus timonensis]MCI6067182.1 hypothetical protein [Galactobacillus timonensis]
MVDKQIKSKQRVSDHGEVFTADREVNAMLDLVKDETERIDSTFLEPACGEGAFLIKILDRKLSAVKTKYGKNEADYEKYAIVALSSLYGIDIMSDNAQNCRDRLYAFWNDLYTSVCKSSTRDEVREAAKYILQKNILVGNALTLKMVDGNQIDTDQPIIFAEWSMVTGTKIKRRDFRLDVILKAEEDFEQLKTRKKAAITYSLFDDGVDEINSFSYYDVDPSTHEIVPKPLNEYPLVDYWEVQTNG